MAALLESIIPAYPYTQYNDDPDIVAFFDAYNKLAQGYLDYFNNLNLPCWTGLRRVFMGNHAPCFKSPRMPLLVGRITLLSTIMSRMQN